MNLFVERSLKYVFDFFKEAVFSDDIARSKGLLQSVDPRIKIALLFILLITTCFARTFGPLAGLYAISVILAALSGIDVIFFIKRVWFFIPIFTLIIAIPAVFIQGLSSAILFVMRVTTCISFVVVFTITSKHNRLLRSLRSLGVPVVFTSILDMTYRYLFLFLKIFEEMHASLKSRLIKGFDAHEARRWIASRIAFLFRRSLKMSEDVYMAMLARGYGLEEGKDGK